MLDDLQGDVIDDYARFWTGHDGTEGRALKTAGNKRGRRGDGISLENFELNAELDTMECTQYQMLSEKCLDSTSLAGVAFQYSSNRNRSPCVRTQT